ncbi:hypothetical protein EDI_196360 [Entamoeba dispar SAW760]|uniref:Exocyst complex component Sec3 C-terminal domain-containing protein n=1 Tax=Entamoeba dispar (strain ATCC PRA-260 / SAW760) TaxID=370354 RepID=B0EL30_ENTDS|nr:uncharacterized protein EDI_196360 [Entamoeba dispar SAW760]EDR24792.1 hypothetical protein EDI_196360 [Entamoeba dispar SAW760]|eukprot:EDR24792.1 hypothetical protein EDI_196360 [Entamoeba dispar SAW760]
MKITKIDTATKYVGKFGKKVIGGVGGVASGITTYGKKAVTNPFGTIGDVLVGSAEQRSDVDYLFKDKTVLSKAYGSLIKNQKSELTYSDVLVISAEQRNIFLNFVSKNIIYRRLDIDEQWKLNEIKGIEFIKESNGMIISNKHKTNGKKFVFASSLNRAEFAYCILSNAKANEFEIEFEMSLDELVDYIEKEKKRQKTDGRLHLVSKEDELILKKMLNEHGEKIDIDELQKKLEKQIIIDEATLYKNYLNREEIGNNVNTLFDEVQKALDELETFCLKLDVDIENIRPGVELIQHNNNKLEIVHSNQTKFMNCMEQFIDSLLIDPVSLYTVRNCQDQLNKAVNLDNICKSATVVALAANYQPPEEMKNMIALKEEQDFDKQVLKDFAVVLSSTLQNKLKVEMDFLKLNKVVEFGSSLFGKEKQQKETLEGAHGSLQPFGGLIAWLRMYATDEFLNVKKQYVEKMSKIANEYFDILVDQQKKNIQEISEDHESAFEMTEFDGPKPDKNGETQIIPKEIFNDRNDKFPDKRPMFDVVKSVIETIAVNVIAEFKFLLEVFQMEENGPNGINVLIDDVYKQSFDALDKLINYIEEHDPFVLLRIIYLCKTANVNIDISTQDYSKLLKKQEKEQKQTEKEQEELVPLQQLNKNEIKREQGTRELIVQKNARTVCFEWLDHFYEVLSNNAMKKFNNFIDKQITQITNTVINPKKHGVTVHFLRLPYFFNYLQIAAGEEEVWEVLNDVVQPIIAKLLRSSFDWLKSIKDSQVDQKPTITLRFQNYYFFKEKVSFRVIRCLEPFVKESENEYMIALKNLCLLHCNLHFGKFYDFFDHIARLIPSMKRPEEIAYQSSYSKQMAAKTCKLIVTPQLTRSIDYMCKSIKHHIKMTDHRMKAWNTLCDFLKSRYIEAERNCELVYKHKFDLPSEDLDKIFNAALKKTFKFTEAGEMVTENEESSISETFEG